MGELKIHLPAKLEQRFRKAAMSVHGYGRGSISKAAIEALTKWCTDHELTIQQSTHSAEERPTAEEPKPPEPPTVEVPNNNEETFSSMQQDPSSDNRISSSQQ